MCNFLFKEFENCIFQIFLKMWRLIRNDTVGGVGQEAGGEEVSRGEVAKNATEIGAKLADEVYKGWKLVKEGGPNVTAELDVGDVPDNSSHYNNDPLSGSSGTEIGM